MPRLPRSWRDRANLPDIGKDPNGVPLLHQDLQKHLEKLAVFLTFRNAFTEEEINENLKGKKRILIEARVESLYETRRHLLPLTDLKRAAQVLQSLLHREAFAADSEIRAAFEDITDEEIWTRDPRIIHRLPLTDEGSEMELSAISNSKLEKENVPYPGSSARYVGASLPALDILDHTSDIKPIPRGPKVTAPTGPKFISTQPTGNGLTQENLSRLNISMGEDRSFHKPLGSLQVCRSDENLSRLHVNRADSGIHHRPLGPNKGPKPLIGIGNNQPAWNKWSAEQVTNPPLPFKLQIAVLATTQQLLEEACFYFAQKWLPALLKREKWDVPEKGELHIWWKVIRDWSVPADAVNFGVLDVGALFIQASQIRHHAVHRLDCPIPKLKVFLQSAMLILLGLLDNPRAAKLQTIQAAFNNYDFAVLEETLQVPLQHHADPTNHQIQTSDSKEGIVDRPTKRQRVQSPNLQDNISQPKLGTELGGMEVIDLTQDSDEDMT